MNRIVPDRASEYSRQYLDILERQLGIEYTSVGTPIFVPERVSRAALRNLKAEVSVLRNGDARDDAISDMAAFRSTHPLSIQTTAVGWAEDSDLQVKLGLLLGQRLVLWDTVVASILGQPIETLDLQLLGKTVNRLLLLRPIIDDGALVFLPQPRTWLERAARYFQEMPAPATENATFQGYVNAAALLQEGIALHPYLMPQRDEYEQIVDRLAMGDDPYFSPESRQYHGAMTRLLQDQRLPLGIAPEGLYQVVNEMGDNALQKFQRRIAEQLSLPRAGMSPTEREVWLDQVISELADGAAELSGKMVGPAIDRRLTGLRAIKATFGVVADGASSGAFSAVASGLDAVGAIGSYIQKAFAHTGAPLIYQVFTRLELAEEDRWRRELADEMELRGHGRIAGGPAGEAGSEQEER